MQEIVGVRFKKLGKIYFFDPDGIKLNKNQNAFKQKKNTICEKVF